jgi:glycosyltransferase
MIKISVITAVFNNKDTVGQAIDSVLSQSYPSIESIVIDGASTDGTLAVLEPYRPCLGMLISERDQGIYDALNKGIKHATGDVVGFLHADDVFENHQVLAKVALAFEDPAVDAVYGDLVYVEGDNLNNVIRYWRAGSCSLSAIKWGWMPPHPTFYVRRSVYERFGAFNTAYRISADYDSFLRFFLMAKIRTKYIHEVLIRMRIGGVSNRSIKTICIKSWEDMKVIQNNKVGGICTLIFKNLRKVSQFWRH